MDPKHAAHVYPSEKVINALFPWIRLHTNTLNYRFMSVGGPIPYLEHAKAKKTAWSYRQSYAYIYHLILVVGICTTLS